MRLENLHYGIQSFFYCARNPDTPVMTEEANQRPHNSIGRFGLNRVDMTSS